MKIISTLIFFIAFFYNQAYTQSVISTQKVTSCDTVPDFYQKFILFDNTFAWIRKSKVTLDNENIFVGGLGLYSNSREGLIGKTDSIGNVKWIRGIGDFIFNPNPGPGSIAGQAEHFQDFAFDDENGIIALGKRSNGDIMVVKLNLDGTTIWEKNLIHGFGGANYDGFIHTLNNGNFLIAGEGRGISNVPAHLFLVEIDHNGSIIKSKSLSFTNNAAPGPDKIIELNNGDKLLLANATYSGNPICRKAFIISLDENYNVNWSKEMTTQDSSHIGLEFTSLEKTENEIFLAGNDYIDNNPIDRNSKALILNLDYDGNVNWARTYTDTVKFVTEVIWDLVIDNHANLWCTTNRFFSFYGNNEEDYSLLKMDTSGNLLENFRFGGANREPHGYLDIDDSNNVLISGSSFSFSSNHGGLYLVKSDSTGYAGGCNEGQLDIIVEDIPISIDTVSFLTFPFPGEITNLDIEVKDIPFTTKEVCCEDLPDADIMKIEPLIVCEDSVLLSIKLCNTGAVDLPANFPIAIFSENPVLNNAMAETVLSLSQAHPQDSCIQYEMTVSLSLQRTLFFVCGMNENHTTPLQFPCDFPLTNTNECSYYNNLDSLVVPNYSPLSFTLGNDTLLCPNEKLELNISENFAAYLWQDGSTENTFSVNAAGSYILTTTDVCGTVKADTIEVAYFEIPMFDLGADSVYICVEDSVHFEIPDIFEAYEWRSNPINPNLSCDTCASTTLYPPQYWNRRMIGIGYTVEGCRSRDTMYIIPSEFIPNTEIDTFICKNELLQIGNQFYPPDTTVSIIYNSFENCDSTIILTIHAIDTSLTQITTTACLGDTLFFDNTPILAGEIKTFQYPNAKGCDSTIVVQVNALSPAFSSEAITICAGETTSIFGNIETEAGIYTQTYPAFNGCDSTHQIELVVYPEVIAEITTVATCEGENIGQASLNIQSGTSPFIFEWSKPNESIAEVKNLAAGNHQVTITDANDCQEILTFFIETQEMEAAELHCEPQVYAPNVFSPNGDSVNDWFYLQSNDRVANISFLRIFDRWGELVFDNTNFLPNEENSGWNGVLDGEIMSPQVFIWQAEVEFLTGERKVFYGDLVLAR